LLTSYNPNQCPAFNWPAAQPLPARIWAQTVTAADGHLNGPIDDIQLRSWGIQLVDGRMPGFAAIVGAAKSNEVAVKIVRELQRRNILTFLSGNVNGRSSSTSWLRKVSSWATILTQYRSARIQSAPSMPWVLRPVQPSLSVA
jgi:hypothetical protein